jgi:hypothetical protein
LQGGTLLLNGKTPEQWGVPNWRTQVTYVPQNRTQQKGTPSELYFAAQVGVDSLQCSRLMCEPSATILICKYRPVRLQQFKAQRGRPRGDLPALIAELGLEQGVLNQPWAELSVGDLPMHACCVRAAHSYALVGFSYV